MSTTCGSGNLLGLVLAGGRSLRMGCDKSLLPLAGVPLLQRVVERLAVQVSPVVIGTNGDGARFDRFGLPVVNDRFAAYQGPLAGIMTAMVWAREHHVSITHILSVAADSPFFPLDLAEKLCSAADRQIGGRPLPANRTIILSQTGRRLHPTFGLWPVDLAEDLQDFLQAGRRRVHGFLQEQEYLAVSFDAEGSGEDVIDPFFNINRREDLQYAENWLERNMAEKKSRLHG